MFFNLNLIRFKGTILDNLNNVRLLYRLQSMTRQAGLSTYLQLCLSLPLPLLLLSNPQLLLNSCSSLPLKLFEAVTSFRLSEACLLMN